MNKENVYIAMKNANIRPIKVEHNDRYDLIKVSQFLRAKLYHKDEELTGIELVSSMNVDDEVHYTDTMILLDILIRMSMPYGRNQRHSIYQALTTNNKGTYTKGTSNVTYESNVKWLKVTAVNM